MHVVASVGSVAKNRVAPPGPHLSALTITQQAIEDALDRGEQDPGRIATSVLHRLDTAGFSVTRHDGRSHFLTTVEAAARRRLTVQALSMERSRGMGPPYVQDGGRILYPENEFEQWLSERTVTPPAWMR